MTRVRSVKENDFNIVNDVSIPDWNTKLAIVMVEGSMYIDWNTELAIVMVEGSMYIENIKDIFFMNFPLYQ